MCALSATRCSSSDETGPASSCVLCCDTWDSGQAALPLGAWSVWIPAWHSPARGRLHLHSSCQRQARRTSCPCHAPSGSLWWSIAHGCAPSSQPLQALGALWHLLCPAMCLPQALWPGSVMEEPSFLLMVLPLPPGWGRTTSGLCPYLSQHCAISDCIFGIKSELLLHPLRSRLARSFIWAQLRLC